jgi:Protein of unknown function (DUF3179)
LNDRELHFHLAGINNQNFLMRDEETGSYWQQVTGAAIAGPLKGERLTLVAQDELTFALWKKERPNGTVLVPLPRYAAKYEKASWEHEIGELPTVIHGAKGTLSDRETIIGVVVNGVAKAYPLNKLTAQSPVLLDTVGGEPIMLMLGSDGKSLRVFSRDMGGNTLEFFRPTDASANDPYTLLDATTLDKWNFEGCAVTGDKSGKCLARVNFLKDYWFDWQHYHPHSEIYRH